MKGLGVCGLFCVLQIAFVCASDSAFNFEVGLRVDDNVRSFLTAAQFPAVELSLVSKFGFVSRTNAYSRAQQLMYSVLQATPQVSSLYLLFDDVGIGMFQTLNMMLTSQPIEGGGCVIASVDEGERCFNLTTITPRGLPGQLIRPMTLQAEVMGVFATNTSQWSSVVLTSPTEPGLIFTVPMFDANRVRIGTAGAGVPISLFESFLAENSAHDSDQRVVFIVEEDTGLLVAASVPGVSVAQVANSTVRRVRAQDCEHQLIRDASAFLFGVDDIDEEQLLVHGGYYIQNKPFHAAGVDWQIVVVRPVAVASDIIATNSTLAVVLLTLSSLVIAFSLLLALWMLRFKSLRLWVTAQPSLLLVILCSNILCGLSSFALIGEPSTASCFARQWLVTLAVTFACGAFLAKLVRVWIATNTGHLLHRDAIRQWLVNHIMIVVCAVVGVQCLILVCWSAIDPLSPVIAHTINVASVESRAVCKSSSVWGQSTALGLIWAIVAVVCVLAFVTRNVSGMFTESWATMIVCYQGTVFGIVLELVGNFAGLSSETMLALVICAMLCFSVTTQGALFLPRVYRQVTLGDLSDTEVRQAVLRHLKISQIAPMAQMFDTPKIPNVQQKQENRAQPTIYVI